MKQNKELSKYLKRVFITETIILILLLLGYSKQMYSMKVVICGFIILGIFTTFLITKKIKEIKKQQENQE